MAVSIVQAPLYRMLATDEEIIFAVDETTIVATKFKVKFIAEVYVGETGAGPFTQTKVATLKATPNDKGVGIFDFSRILEAYVSPDYLGGFTVNASSVDYYTKKNQLSYSSVPHSIHEIDKHSMNRKVCRLFGIKFSIEYKDAIDEPLQNTSSSTINSDTYYIHNATRQEDDVLGYETQRGWFGLNYHYHKFVLRDNVTAKFLTNAPTTQLIGDNDYCTIGYFAQSDELSGNSLLGHQIGTSTATRELVKTIKIQFYDAAGAATGSLISYINSTANGSLTWQSNSPKAQIQYTGVGTANIKGAGETVPSDWAYYTVIAYDNTGAGYEKISQEYRFYKQEVCKGFEKFRLTWLNRLGVWDYFNFTKKNVRKVSSKRETYQQLKGNWNELIYSKQGYKGGTKTFSTNSKEQVTLQTDYVTEETSEWLEELFTSPEVFVLQEKTTDVAQSVLNPTSSVYQVQNKYVQPCIVTSKSYTRKTTANDKLKQYTLQIEMSHKKVIQKA